MLAAPSYPIVSLLDWGMWVVYYGAQKRKAFEWFFITLIVQTMDFTMKNLKVVLLCIYVFQLSSLHPWFFFFNNLILSILRLFSLSLWPPGEPISVLDGVPIAIKDEIDCTPYPTTGNSTSYIFQWQCLYSAKGNLMVSLLQLIT